MNELPEIIEMSVPESAWAMWSRASNVDTKGRCNCGHEGLGPAWHDGACPGAKVALIDKVTELLSELWLQWGANHYMRCGPLVDDTCPAGELCEWMLPKSLQF